MFLTGPIPDDVDFFPAQEKLQMMDRPIPEWIEHLIVELIVELIVDLIVDLIVEWSVELIV